MRTTWFVISPYLAAVNQAQSTKIQLFGPGSLGLCAKEKSTLTPVYFYLSPKPHLKFFLTHPPSVATAALCPSPELDRADRQAPRRRRALCPLSLPISLSLGVDNRSEREGFGVLV